MIMEPAALSKHQRHRSANYWQRIRRRVAAVVNKVLQKHSPEGTVRIELEPQNSPVNPQLATRAHVDLTRETSNILEINQGRDAASFNSPMPPLQLDEVPTAYSTEQTSGVDVGTHCPQCGSRFEFNIDNILDLKPLYCSDCGLKLILDVSQSQQGLEFLRTIKRLAKNH